MSEGREGYNRAYLDHGEREGWGLELPHMMAEADNVATRKTFRGTHEGQFMGIPPSGRGVSMGLIDIVRITEGRVVEHWSVGDTLGMMQELVPSLSRDSRRKPALLYALNPESRRTPVFLLNIYRSTQARNHPS